MNPVSYDRNADSFPSEPPEAWAVLAAVCGRACRGKLPGGTEPALLYLASVRDRTNPDFKLQRAAAGRRTGILEAGGAGAYRTWSHERPVRGGHWEIQSVSPVYQVEKSPLHQGFPASALLPLQAGQFSESVSDAAQQQSWPLPAESRSAPCPTARQEASPGHCRVSLLVAKLLPVRNHGLISTASTFFEF